MADQPIKRLRYFTGQFLEALDFQAEQNYHVGIRRRGNRALYGAGIIDDGFNVTPDPDPTRIAISPGTGVDAHGREIVLDSAVSISLAEAGLPGQAYFVTARYYETETDQQTPDADVNEYTRVEERAKIGFDANLANIDTSVAFVIARITVAGDGKLSGRIDASVRQYASARLLGRLGIGTANPSHQLHVVASSTVGLFQSTTDAAFLRLSNNQGVFHQVGISNRQDGRLVLWTSGAGDVLVITRDGQTGIGTIAPIPNSRLSVVGGALAIAQSPSTMTKADAAIHVMGSAGGFDRLLQMSPEGAAKPALNLLASKSAVGTGAEQWWAWGVSVDDKWRVRKGTDIGGDDGLTIDSSGKVGIGTTVPAARLHAAGNGGVVNIEGSDHAYVQWFPKGVSANRKGWIGYGSAGTDALTIQNDAGGINIYGTELLYLLNRQGVVIGKGSDGNGNLTVEGNLAWAGDQAAYGYITLGSARICWGTVGANVPLFENHVGVTFPASFSGNPSVNVTVSDPGYGTYDLKGGVGAYNVSSSGFEILFKATERKDPRNLTFYWLAIGLHA